MGAANEPSWWKASSYRWVKEPPAHIIGLQYFILSNHDLDGRPETGTTWEKVVGSAQAMTGLRKTY